MKILSAALAVLGLAVTVGCAMAQPAAVAFDLDTTLVHSRQLVFGATTILPGREDLNRSLAQLGLHVVRRGPSLSADLNADGFRRADLPATVDGERYHCACPNRMDPPTTLALPIELASVTWDRTSAAPTAGLAGELALVRRAPSKDWRVRGGLEGGAGVTSEGSATASLEGRGQRLGLRAAGGRSYRDARDRSFGALYGYREDDVRWSQSDLSWHAAFGRATAHAQFSRTADVPYAYLLMDERENLVWNGSLAWAGAKFYANRSQHLMDNGLRRSTMGMSTAADQFTAGATGAWRGFEGEAFLRHWNANNTIATSMARVENHMIPRYRQWSAGLARRFDAGATRAHARLAITEAWIADRSRMSLYRTFDPGASPEAWFLPFALGLDRTWADGERIGAGLSAEIASEAPTAEQLFITVRRPMMMGTRKPDWTGSPSLRAPVRASLRGEWRSPLARLELGGSYVDAYVLPFARRSGTTSAVTYVNTDVALATARADGRWNVIEWSTSYTLGWNLDGDRALAEAPPFLASISARPSLGHGLRALVRAEAAGAQRRVDATLMEVPTDAWGRADLGIDWIPAARTRIALEVDNVTNSLYAEHLSYARDPFAAGVRVQEPGRSVRVLVTFGD